jgi:hypothetical protein
MKKGKVGKGRYRVYLAWHESIKRPLEGMGLLIHPGQLKSESFVLSDDGDTVITGVSSRAEFILVDDPGFGPRDLPEGTEEIFLKLVRRRLFGRTVVHAEPVGPPPKGYVLSGQTGRVVWGGADLVRDISPRPIPHKYWVKRRTADRFSTRKRS